MGLPFPPLALFSKYNSVFPILQQPLLQHIKPSVFSSPRAGLACPSDSRLGNSLRSLPCLEPRFRTCISHLPGASLCPEAAHLPRTSSERALRAHVLETCLVIMTRQGPSQSENHVCWWIFCKMSFHYHLNNFLPLSSILSSHESEAEPSGRLLSFFSFSHLLFTDFGSPCLLVFLSGWLPWLYLLTPLMNFYDI